MQDLSQNIENAKNLEEINSYLSFDRQKIVSILSGKKWFQKTTLEIKKKLFLLPPDFDGYLKDIINRKDEYGGMIVTRLQDVLAGNYSVLSVFEVMSASTIQKFTYEYTTWKFGRDQGYRGIILFEEEGKIKYFLIRKTEKFAIGESIYETVGTFVKFSHISKLHMPSEIQSQIEKQLGIKHVVIKKYIPLGKIAIDPVLANSTPSLYAAVVDLPGNNDLKKIREKVYKTKPISFNLIIEPIEAIWDYVEKTDESFFLAVVARLAAMGIINRNT